MTETGELPGPDQPVSFATHIRPLFRERDRGAMSWAFDLGSYDDVRTQAETILGRLAAGEMPCDGAWPAERVEVFRQWARTGMQPCPGPPAGNFRHGVMPTAPARRRPSRTPPATWHCLGWPASGSTVRTGD